MMTWEYVIITKRIRGYAPWQGSGYREKATDMNFLPGIAPRTAKAYLPF